MASTFAEQAEGRHLERLEQLRPSMAKAVKKIETTWPELVAMAIQRCFSLAGVTQKEAAALLGRDVAQVSRWLSAKERPQLDVLFAVEQFRQPLVIAFAELAGQAVEIETVVRVRRTA